LQFQRGGQDARPTRWSKSSRAHFKTPILQITRDDYHLQQSGGLARSADREGGYPPGRHISSKYAYLYLSDGVEIDSRIDDIIRLEELVIEPIKFLRSKNFIGHSRPTLGAAEEAAALRVLRSRRLAAGPEVRRFETALARAGGAAHAVAVQSGSAALLLALRGLRVGPGREVILPSYACAAVMAAVDAAGARPVLADVDPGSFNLTPEAVRRRFSRRTGAVIVPHLFGRPAPVAAIRVLGAPVVEDCAMAFGAKAGGRRLGSLGDAAVCSFYATKLLTTAMGGAVLTRDRRVAAEVRDLIAYDNREDYRPRCNVGMSDLQAAIGQVQLARLPRLIAARRRLAAFYRRALRDAGVILPAEAPGHLYYRFVCRAARGTCDGILRRLAAAGIEAKRPVFRPLHRYLGLPAARFPGAEDAHRRAFSIPLYPELTMRQAARVAAAVRAAAR
jgi:dTDP-4-amino-4,6-dideoxygalactose transaminase